MLPNTLLTAEQKAELQSLHRIAGALCDTEIEPHYRDWEKAGLVHRELFRKMGENGYLCADVPEQYGGAGASVLFRSPWWRCSRAGATAVLWAGCRCTTTSSRPTCCTAAPRRSANTGCRAWSAVKRWQRLA